MKFRRYFSVFIAVLTIFGLIAGITVFAKNNGSRHTVCTALSSQAKSYYQENSIAFSSVSKLKGGNDNCLTTVNSDLFSKLHNLMANTMTDSISYSSLSDYWYDTDANNGSSKPRLFYSDIDSGSFNREHVWPKSRASFKKLNGGCDPHHLRPTNSSMNSTRSNYCMGYVKGVISGYKTKTSGNGSIYYSSANDRVEVDDKVKGDVARIFLYVYCRWEEPNLFMDTPNPIVGPGDDANNGKKVIESLDTLLEWCKLDPVDSWEMARNDECQNIVGNRNVFIDYPEYAWLLFGEAVPTDMVTPSGEAKKGTSGNNQGGNTSTDTSTNTSTNTSSNTSEDVSTNISTNASTNTSTNTSTENTTSGDSTNAQGGIDKKPQNGGKPFDPNNIGNQQSNTDNGQFVLDTWVIIVIVIGSLVVVGGLISIVIIKKRRIKD